MLVRLQSASSRWLHPTTAPPKEQGVSRTYLMGLLLIASVTIGLLVWLGYRWITRPGWLTTLPSTAIELISLLEAATAATVACIWVGLWLRQRRQKRLEAEQTLVPAETVEELYALDPYAFERYVANLFKQRGYAVQLRGGSGDHGVDVELTGRGGKRAVVQCKRYRSTVGEDVVRDLFGTMLHERASHGFLVTTAEISQSAREWAIGKPITLIDGETLVQIAEAMRRKL